MPELIPIYIKAKEDSTSQIRGASSFNTHKLDKRKKPSSSLESTCSSPDVMQSSPREVHDPGALAVDPSQSMTISAFHAHIIKQIVGLLRANRSGQRAARINTRLHEENDRHGHHKHGGKKDSISSSPAADGSTPDLQHV